ncbi:MAG TPA: hypothetical protein VFC57_02025 [Aeromicrobium sp.]|nr:hypothetical protein [Aeromicrobium sp.]
MAEETWHHARLIPTSGINGAKEQERRATSALLAVLSIVPDYGKALLSQIGAPAGNVSTFIEVPFDLDGSRIYPDGLVRIKRGSRQWTALVEVKTGKNELEPTQLENYLDVAKEQGFDALITISNEIPPVPGQHPTKVDKRKLRKVELHHWSWSYVLATAIVQKEHRGVSDPEQAWILGELIRYLEHDRSGALELEDMGQRWVAVREAVTSGTLRATDSTALEVVSRFDALLRYASLRLGQRLGTDVTQVLTRREFAEPSTRADAQLASLADTGELTGAIRIPNTVAPITVTADLRANRITCHVDVDAPQDGRPTTRVNWLVRQLKEARADVRIEASLIRARGASAAELLGGVRENPKLLVTNPTREIRSFRVALSVPMGSKRGRGRGAFIDSVLDAIDDFYSETVQHLKAWAPNPPKLRETEAPPEEPAVLMSTALSSQDGPETISRMGTE